MNYHELSTNCHKLSLLPPFLVFGGHSHYEGRPVFIESRKSNYVDSLKIELHAKQLRYHSEKIEFHADQTMSDSLKIEFHVKTTTLSRLKIEMSLLEGTEMRPLRGRVGGQIYSCLFQT